MDVLQEYVYNIMEGHLIQMLDAQPLLHADSILEAMILDVAAP